MILPAIKAYWEYQKADRDPGHIGMSGIGHCGRQLAYTRHLVPGKPLDWRAKIIFDDGNRHHEQIRKAITEGLILTESCYSLADEEAEVVLGILKGHIDGRLVHSLDCKQPDHKDMLLEVKSMNDRGFIELKKTQKLGLEYRAQASAYLRASGMDSAMMVIKNKNTGEMMSFTFTEDGDLLDQRLEVLEEVYSSSDPEDVNREYAHKDNGYLPWQCNYCPFVQVCWRHEGVVAEGVHSFVLQSVLTELEKAKNKKKSEKTDGT